MRITLNLATHPYADLGPAIKRLRIAMAVLAAIAIGQGLGLHAFHQQAEAVRAREHALDAKIAALAMERQSYDSQMHLPANAEVLAKVGILNRLIDQKNFSWTQAMEDLETVLPGGVQVSNIEPIQAKDGSITLHLRVIGPRDRSLQLIQNMEHSRRFFLPRITGENTESTGAPGERLEPVSATNRVNVDLLANYNPSSAEETRPAPKAEEPSVEKAARTVQRPAAPRAAFPVPSSSGNPRVAIRSPYIGTSRPTPGQRINPHAGGPQ
ncbi:MAG: fimbrial assembly protein [Terracidiphilus sp.]|nr:fimbrial assembly protein [Terracidiphilus sp.]